MHIFPFRIDGLRLARNHKIIPDSVIPVGDRANPAQIATHDVPRRRALPPTEDVEAERLVRFGRGVRNRVNDKCCRRLAGRYRDGPEAGSLNDVSEGNSRWTEHEAGIA